MTWWSKFLPRGLRTAPSSYPETEAPVKIYFDLTGGPHSLSETLGDPPQGISEHLWADSLPGGRYRLRNIPFEAFGVAFRDIVAAEPDGQGVLRVTGVLERSGSSTFRILLPEGHFETEFEPRWPSFESMDCLYERYGDTVIGIAVAPYVPVDLVWSLLADGEAAGAWAVETAYRFEGAETEV